MSPRSQPKIHHLQLKSHKLSILVTVPPTTTIAFIKHEAFSSLASHVNQVEDLPKITSEDDLEICRAIKDKGRSTGKYEILDTSKQVRDYGLAGWDVLYLQFRDQSSGELAPIMFSQPSIDEEEEAPSESDYPMSSTAKGKRKAHFDD